MRFAKYTTVLLPFLVLAGCSSDSSEGSPGGGDGGSNGDSANTDGGANDSGPLDCEETGHFGPMQTSFTLPVKESIYYEDVQVSFPDVDWANIDRLYIQAGKYKQLRLGNLPNRDRAHPLVITNIGGQVQVGPDMGANFIWSMSGGSNWILTGRYDPVSKTGDAAYPGHFCGGYPGSRDKYGFLSDDALDKTGAYTHMGLAVGDATDFEIEFVEVRYSSFAGIRLLNQYAADKPALPMANVRLHDNYVHDTDGEGIYLGWTGDPPSNPLPGLQVYNNRFVRTGNEALQIQNLGEGTHVHHNVIAYASLHWRDNGLGKYQDNNAQVLVRSGTVEIDHNVFMGGAATLLNFFSSPETGDGERNVTFHDNYFSDTRGGYAGYLNGTGGPGSNITFEHNTFRALDFSYTEVYPTAVDPHVILSANPAVQSPIRFISNTWEGEELPFAGLPGPNGAYKNFIADRNNAGVPVAAFAFAGGEQFPTTKVEFWIQSSTLAPDNPPRTYVPGDIVIGPDANLYRCKAENKGKPPAENLDVWELIAPPADDLRAAAGSPYEGYGVY